MSESAMLTGGAGYIGSHIGLALIELVKDMIHRHSIDAVIHVAGFKAVGVSVAQLLKYYADPQCVFESCKRC